MIQSIFDSAFKDNTELLTIGECFYPYFIGDNAFSGCTKLRYVDTVPTEYFGKYCFYNCKAITEINSHFIGYNLYIGESAFEGCDNLTYVYMYAPTTIHTKAFKNCSKLKIFSSEVDSEYNTYFQIIGDEAFSGCSSLVNSGYENYHSSSIDRLYYLQKIGSKAFKDCTTLTHFNLYENLEYIAPDAFSGCTGITNLRCSFTENAISGAPWGATNATIAYYAPVS